jgi:hypothetical protein
LNAVGNEVYGASRLLRVRAGELIRSHAGVARAKGDVDPKRDDEIINVKPLSNMLK